MKTASSTSFQSNHLSFDGDKESLSKRYSDNVNRIINNFELLLGWEIIFLILCSCLCGDEGFGTPCVHMMQSQLISIIVWAYHWSRQTHCGANKEGQSE